MLDRIEVQGVEPEDHLVISSAGYDFQDQSTLMPLWAGIPAAERAEKLINNTLTNSQRFWRPMISTSRKP